MLVVGYFAYQNGWFTTHAQTCPSGTNCSTTTMISTVTGCVGTDTIVARPILPYCSTTTLTTTSTHTSSSGNNKYIEIKAFDIRNGQTEYIAGGQYGIASGSGYTATSLLALIQQIHAAIGNFNLIRFIRVECENAQVNPNMMASSVYGTGYNWNGNLDSYFTAIQKAAGGNIIPDLDLDVYDGANDCPNYPNPDPSTFFSNANSLLSLSAIASGNRYAMLEAYDVWYTWGGQTKTQSQVSNFFQTLQAQGWKGFIPQDNVPENYQQGDVSKCASSVFKNGPDYGYANYYRSGIFQINNTISPYVFVNTNLICSIKTAEPYLSGVLAGIETQPQSEFASTPYCDQQFTSAMAAFDQCLSDGQRQFALTYLATHQSNYIFIYPVVGGEFKILYDAKAEGDLSLIESLMVNNN